MNKTERGRARNRSRSRSNDRERSRSRGRDRSRDRPANARLAEKRVYISNIPYDVRWQDLKDLFRKEVGEVAYVELFSDENDKPRGCGVIEFESNALAKKAIEKMHRHELSGRKMVVKEDYEVERDKTGRIVIQPNNNSRRDRDRSPLRDRVMRDREWERRRESVSPNSSGGWKFGNTFGLSQQFLESLGVEGPLVSRVFISNLEFRVDEKKLREVFRLAGKIANVDVNKDKDGKSRGHGTIEYEHPVEAVQAISMFNNQELYERRLHVRMDRLSDPIDELLKGRYPDGLKGIGMGLGLNGQPLIDVSRTLSSNNNTVSNVTAVIGGGLGNTTTPLSNALAANANAIAAMNMSGMNVGLASGLMGTQGLDSMNVPVASGTNPFGMSLGGALSNTATNQFGAAIGTPSNNQFGVPTQAFGANSLAGNLGMAQAQAQAQVQANQLSMNQMLQNSGVSIGTASTAGGAGQFQNTGSAGEYGYSTSVYSTPSTNYNTAYQREKQQFGNGSGNTPTPSNTCIISNLPPNMSWQLLKAKFRECGEVMYAEMRDKSTGVVRFANERDAERAIKVFDQSRVDGRIVDVRFL